MLTKKSGPKNSNLVVKNKYNDSLENYYFEFLAVVGQFKLKKNAYIIFQKNLFHYKKLLLFLYWKKSLI